MIVRVGNQVVSPSLVPRLVHRLFKVVSKLVPSESDSVVKLGKDGRIVDFVEKSKTTVYRDVSTACYYLRSDELKLIDVYLRQRGSDNLGSFFNWLQSNGIKLVAYTFESQWFDIGDRMRMLDANRHFLQDIREGEIDDKTVIRGPVQIEQGAKIQDSIIGPNVYIGHGCKISHSQIRDSIIMKRVSITNYPFGPTLIKEIPSGNPLC